MQLVVVNEQVAAAKSAWYDQRRAYRRNCAIGSCTEFLLENIETDRLRQVQLWESVDKLLGRGRARACSSLDVESLNDVLCSTRRVRVSPTLLCHQRR